jgi:hypothetical protein
MLVQRSWVWSDVHTLDARARSTRGLYVDWVFEIRIVAM